MKTEIHPKYFSEVEIKCSCGNIVISGSTREKMKTELCSKCHPFYTGQQKLVDTAGRVDKFEEKRKKAKVLKDEAVSRVESKKKKPEAYIEKEVSVEVLEKSGSLPKKSEGKWATPLGDAPAQEVAKNDAFVAEEAPKKKTAKKKPAKAKKSETEETSKE